MILAPVIDVLIGPDAAFEVCWLSSTLGSLSMLSSVFWRKFSPLRAENLFLASPLAVLGGTGDPRRLVRLLAGIPSL